MIRHVLLLVFMLLLSGCFVKKRTTYGEERTVTVDAGKKTSKPLEEEPEEPLEVVDAIDADRAQSIINTAMGYTGVRYKYGGTTRKGMDCSGLLFVAFKEHDVDLPRVSYQMADEGKRIRLQKVEKGDLLFFKTSKRGKRINHVGLVVDVQDDEIKFIHATSSRGVIVSSLREGFWNYAFVKATRVL